MEDLQTGKEENVICLPPTDIISNNTSEMDAEFINNGMEQSTSEAGVDNNPGRFPARGVFPHENAFWCYICNKSISHLQMIPMHVVGKRHCLKLEEARASYEKIDENFSCKLCENYSATNWKAYLVHFEEKNHFAKLSNDKNESFGENSQNSDPSFSYKTLLMNQIIEDELKTYFCCCCKVSIVGENLVLQHINEQLHKERQRTKHKNEYAGNYRENECARFVRNFIFHVSFSTFHCDLCDRSISGTKNCWEHIRGTGHIDNLLVKEDPASYKSPLQIPPLKLKQDETSESLAKLMLDNSITGPSKTNEYTCKLCDCLLPAQKNIFEHISGKRHKTSMERGGNVSTKTVDKSEETSAGSSSSWETTDNTSESWETFEGESQSYGSYETSSYSWKSSDNITDSWETISIQGSSTDSRGSTLFKISSKLMPLISKHLLRHLDKEIYCPHCDAHLRSDQCLINHTKSRYHIAELKRYKDQQIAKGKPSSSSQKTSDESSPVNVIKKKEPLPVKKHEIGTETRNEEANKAPRAQQSSCFEIPKNLIPLISKHMLLYRKKELFCPACEARLQSPQSLVDHTRSRNHVITLRLYKAKIAKESQESVDTSGRNSSTSSSLSNAITKNKSSSNTVRKALNTEELQSKLFRLPNYLIPMLAPHSLQHLTKSVFCQACQLHVRHVNTLFEHMTGKNHIARLSLYKAQIRSDGKNSPLVKVPKSNAAVNVVDEKPLNIKSQNTGTSLKNITANPPNSQSNLMDIPKKLLPLIAIHSLKHLENEIYCVACQVHLMNDSSLVSHTSSHRHAARLESFRASTLDKNKNKNVGPSMSLKPNVVDACRELKMMKENIAAKMTKKIVYENKTGLENCMNKLTIGGVNSRQKLPENRLRNLMDRLPRNQKERRRDTRPKQSRPFDPKYLKANMEHIYNVNPEKLRILGLSCQLCFPKTAKSVYCLICEKTVASELQTFYEHICGKAHTVYLAEAEQNDKHFINYQDQFSDLTLAKEFMQEAQEETIECFACDESMKNEDLVIHEHINKDFHKERKLLWNKEMEKIMREILTKMKSTWYNIQKYWCVSCDIEYNTEFHFAEHMDGKKHDKVLKKMGSFQDKLIYDSCISCATLWLGFPGIYAQHCDQPMHKYLVRTGDFSVFKLPIQAITLLQNSVPEVTSLIELSDQVLTTEQVKADALLKCLEDTVKPLFPNAKAHPFGSRVSGLGFPDSDIDVFLNCGTYDGYNTTQEHQEKLIIAVEGCLYANQEAWEIEETLVSTRTPIIKLRHRDTELRCDVSFKNGLSVENTKLLKCFIDNYPLCRYLMLFLKKWLSLCNLSGSHYITNYANCWYVIFYLQSRSILPSVASLIAKENKSKLIDGWETGICETFDVDEQELTFTELLHGFFEFYSTFDFRDSVACPILGRTIPKQDFTELNLLPKEMSPYIDHVVTKSSNGLVELFRIDSEMCVQDPYDLSHNLTKAVRKFTLNRFRRLCASSAEVLNNFSQH